MSNRNNYDKRVALVIRKANCILVTICLVLLVFLVVIVNTHFKIKESEYSIDKVNKLEDRAESLVDVMNIRYNGYDEDTDLMLYNVFKEKSANKIIRWFNENTIDNIEKIDVTNDIDGYTDWKCNAVRKEGSRYYVYDTSIALNTEGHYLVLEFSKGKKKKKVSIDLFEHNIGVTEQYKDERYNFSVDEYNLYGNNLLRVIFINKMDERMYMDVYISKKGKMEIKNIKCITDFNFDD